MRPVKTALIGCGKVGAIHAQALATLAESQFVGVYDADFARAEQFAVRYGAQAFSSLDELLQRSGAEAVTICTPHPLHEEPCCAAAAAGLHVLVEKPLAATVAACDRMLTATRASGVKLAVVSQRRWLPPVQRLKAAIDAGKIGQPVLGTFQMFSWRDEAYYRSDPWRGRLDTEGGGVLINQSPHHLDLLLWFMGPVEEVSGYTANLNHPYVEIEDTAVAIIRFRSGGLGNVVASLSQKPGIYSKVHVHGASGASVGVQTDSGATFIAGMTTVADPPINDLWTIPGEEHLLALWQAEDQHHFAQIDATTYYHTVQIRDFLQAIREDREALVTGEQGKAVVQIFAAIYESQKAGRPVRINN